MLPYIIVEGLEHLLTAITLSTCLTANLCCFLPAPYTFGCRGSAMTVGSRAKA